MRTVFILVAVPKEKSNTPSVTESTTPNVTRFFAFAKFSAPDHSAILLGSVTFVRLGKPSPFPESEYTFEMLLNRKDAEGKRYFSNLVCQDALEAAAKACQLGSVKVLLDPTYEIKYNKTFLSHVLSVAANTSFLKEFEEEYNGVGVTQKSRNKPAEQLAAEQKPCKDVMAYLGNKMQEMDEQAVAKKNKKK